MLFNSVLLAIDNPIHILTLELVFELPSSAFILFPFASLK